MSHQEILRPNKKAVHDESWTASVNCWDWPEADWCHFQKGGALCSKTTEPES